MQSKNALKNVSKKMLHKIRCEKKFSAQKSLIELQKPGIEKNVDLEIFYFTSIKTFCCCDFWDVANLCAQ